MSTSAAAATEESEAHERVLSDVDEDERQEPRHEQPPRGRRGIESDAKQAAAAHL